MREIEIKVRVSDEAALQQKLTQLGTTLSQPKKQHDVVYGRKEGGAFIHGDNWLRVRTEDDSKVYFTLKRSVSGELDSIEHEVVVDDAVALTKLIQALGYELYSDLTKIRRKAQYGEIELCLDKVPELGTFLEGERLCEEDADLAAVQAELWELFHQLGLQEADQATSGYDVLLREQQGLGR